LLANFDLKGGRQIISGDDRALRHAILGSNAAQRLAGLHNNLPGLALCDRCLLRGIRSWRSNVRRNAVRYCWRWRFAGSDKPDSYKGSRGT
jgi:hypothetical protein